MGKRAIMQIFEVIKLYIWLWKVEGNTGSKFVMTQWHKLILSAAF